MYEAKVTKRISGNAREKHWFIIKWFLDYTGKAPAELTHSTRTLTKSQYIRFTELKKNLDFLSINFIFKEKSCIPIHAEISVNWHHQGFQ